MQLSLAAPENHVRFSNSPHEHVCCWRECLVTLCYEACSNGDIWLYRAECQLITFIDAYQFVDAESVAEPKELVVVPGANRVDFYDGSLAHDLTPLERIDVFLKKALA